MNSGFIGFGTLGRCKESSSKPHQRPIWLNALVYPRFLHPVLAKQQLAGGSNAPGLKTPRRRSPPLTMGSLMVSTSGSFFFFFLNLLLLLLLLFLCMTILFKRLNVYLFKRSCDVLHGDVA